MKKLALAILIALAASVGAFAQSSNICFDTTFTGTGRKQLQIPGGGTGSADRYSSETFAYKLTGSPSGVSITVEASDYPLPTTPATICSATTTTTNNTNIPMCSGSTQFLTYRYWYANLGTFTGGSSPTLTVTSCMAPSQVPGGTAGSMAWNGLTAPTGDLTLNFNSKNTTFSSAGLLTYGGDTTITGLLTGSGDAQITQGANGDNALTISRKTNTLPTGKLIAGTGASGSPLVYSLNVDGSTTQSGSLTLSGSTSGSTTLSATATGGTLNLGSTNATVTSAGALTVASCTGCGGGGGVSIGDAVGSGTAGSVLFVGAGPVLAQDNANLFWDATNKGLGIGTNVLGGGLTVSYLPSSGIFSNVDGVNINNFLTGTGTTGGDIRGIYAIAGADGAGVSALGNIYGVFIDSGGKFNGAALTGDNIALGIADQTTATNNYAIKTGLGLVDFGATVKNHVNPFTSAANVAAVDLDLGNFQTHVLTEDTTCSLSHIRAGEKITFMIQQNAAAAKTFTCGAAQNVIGFMTVDPTLSSVNVQVCDVSPNGTDLYCELGQTGLTGGTF